MIDMIKNIFDPPFSGKNIFFLHIPKCAGTSVNNSLANLYKPWRAANADKVFWLHDIAAREAENALELSQADVRTPLLAYLFESKTRELVMGHFQYSNKLFEKHGERWNFVTILRDPVDRWISHYYFNLNREHQYKIDMPVDEFVDTERGRGLGCIFVNVMTNDLDRQSHDMPELVDIAVERLRKFALVGRTENMQEFGERFESLFGAPLAISQKNVGDNRKKQEIEGISDKTLEKIENICKPDRILYDRIFNT